MLEGAPYPSSSLQQWRQLCYLATLDVSDVERLLSLAASLIHVEVAAQACLIRFRSPYGAPIEASAGNLTDVARLAIAQLDDQLMPRQLKPLRHVIGATSLIAFPLTIGQDCLGSVHIVAMDDDVALDDLQMAMVLLQNALLRHINGEQARRTEQKKLERYQAVQHAMTRVLSQSGNLGDVTPIILQAFCESLEWEIGEFWGVDPASNTLGCTEIWHVPGLELDDFVAATQVMTFAPGAGLQGRVWRSGVPIWITDVTQDPHFPRALLAARHRLRSAFAFPILSGAEISGVIVLLTRQLQPPDSTLAMLLATFGSQIGQFIERKRAERALWESEQQFRATFEQAAVGLSHIGLDGRWLRFNERLCHIVGYTPEELCAKTFQDITHPDDLAADLDGVRKILAGETQRYALEKRYIRKDGALIWVYLTVSLMRDAAGVPQYLIAAVEDIDARKRAEAEAARLTDELRIERDRLVRREVEVRTQIGRDLHDGPVQQVAVAGLSVQYVRKVITHAPERIDEALDDLEDQLKRASHDLRTVLYELRPLGIAEEGLVAVLQQYIGRVRDQRGLKIHFRATAKLPRLAPEHEAAIFIIIQEALNNIRKHARARDAWVQLFADATTLYAEVRDNGRGFDVAQIQANYIQRGSFGLLNMTERAQLIGGACTITAQADQGTTVRIAVPLVSPTEGA